MNIFVTGGTGTVGSRLVLALAKQANSYSSFQKIHEITDSKRISHDKNNLFDSKASSHLSEKSHSKNTSASLSHDRIFVLSRKPRENKNSLSDSQTSHDKNSSALQSQNKDSVYYVQGDLCDKDSLEKLDLKGIDVVYHLAANVNELDPKMYEENIESTKNLVELCKKAGVKHIIYLSSSGVLGETNEPSKEDFPYNPKTKYEKSKMISEQIVKESGIQYTILRASVIIAPNKIWITIIGAAKKGFPVIGSGENKFHLSYIDDVVSFLNLVKNNEKAKNQIFHIATKDVPRYIDVYKMICDELKCEMTKKHISVSMIKLILFFKNLFEKNPVINSASVDRLVRNRCLNIDKARDLLGFEPKFNTQMALRETIKSLKLLRLGYSEQEIAEMGLIKK